jgi:hypothetical protein
MGGRGSETQGCGVFGDSASRAIAEKGKGSTEKGEAEGEATQHILLAAIVVCVGHGGEAFRV